jgi:hypothetical protein
MITSNRNWNLLNLERGGFTPDALVDAPKHERISALLGPDGEPLKVGYPRARLGFDLTQRGTRT